MIKNTAIDTWGMSCAKPAFPSIFLRHVNLHCLFSTKNQANLFSIPFHVATVLELENVGIGICTKQPKTIPWIDF